MQAMKGEKGISAVTVSEGMGEELADDAFSKSFIISTESHDINGTVNFYNLDP